MRFLGCHAGTMDHLSNWSQAYLWLLPAPLRGRKPILAWMIRNHWVTGKMIAQHLSPPHTWLQNLARLHEVITAWWLPNELPLALRVGVCYTLVIGVLYLLRNQPYCYKDWVLTGLFLGYAAGLAILASVFFFEPIDERLLTPALYSRQPTFGIPTRQTIGYQVCYQIQKRACVHLPVGTYLPDSSYFQKQLWLEAESCSAQAHISQLF